MTADSSPDSLDLRIDSSDFATALVSCEDDDEPTFSQRAAQVREQARAAAAAETYRILEQGRARLQQQQLRLDLESAERRASTRKSTVKTGFWALIVAAATVGSSVFAVTQVGGMPERVLDLPELVLPEVSVVVDEASELDEVAPAEAEVAQENEEAELAARPAPAPTPVHQAPAAAPAPSVELQDEPRGEFDIVTFSEVVHCGDPNDPLNPCL